MKIKIEFLKETRRNGDCFYFTKANDIFVSNSLSYDYDKAKELYQNIVKNNGKLRDYEEVIESVELDLDK